MKKLVKVLATVLAAIVVVVAALLVKNAIDAGKPAVPGCYWESLETECLLEVRFAQLGPHEVAYAEIASDDASIQRIRLWYPEELVVSSATFPLVVVVNASATPASRYEPFFEHLASWGFIVVGNEDPQAGSGATTAATLDAVLSMDASCLVCGHVDENRIGIAGYSQGGAGALAAATQFENSNRYRAIFTGSAAYPVLADNMGWHYDTSQLGIPYFMVAGTGTSDDTGVEDSTTEFGGVAPLSSLVEAYDSMPDGVPRVRARAVGAEHEDMLVRSDPYMTAWMLWQLSDDQEAAQVFMGEEAEVLHNPGWQDVEKAM